jgi:hypothetical protein
MDLYYEFTQVSNFRQARAEGGMGVHPGQARRRQLCASGIAALAIAIALLAGCATPDLRPFAEQTARLAEAVAGEQRQIALKYVRVIDLNDEACAKEKRAAARLAEPKPETPISCTQKEKREKNAASYAESRRIIDGLLEKSVDYAATLAQLAQAGETGGEAAQSLLASVRQFGNLVGVGGPVITTTVATALEKISTAVTRVQAQNSLAEATAAAQGAIDAVADGIRDMHAPIGGIADTLQHDEKSLLQTLAGDDLVGLFRDATLGREAVSRRLNGPEMTELLKCGATGSDKGKCAQLQNSLRNAEELGRLLDQLRPEYEAFVTGSAAAKRWRADRDENLAAIAKATQVWKAEHARVAGALKRCGGLNAVRCVQVDAASLKVVVDQINEIRSQKDR